MAATRLAGAGFGAWVASMIGIRHDNTQVQGYEDAIKNGQVLMMVDVDGDRVEEIQAEIKQAYPSATIENTDPPPQADGLDHMDCIAIHVV